MLARCQSDQKQNSIKVLKRFQFIHLPETDAEIDKYEKARLLQILQIKKNVFVCTNLEQNIFMASLEMRTVFGTERRSTGDLPEERLVVIFIQVLPVLCEHCIQNRIFLMGSKLKVFIFFYAPN